MALMNRSAISGFTNKTIHAGKTIGTVVGGVGGFLIGDSVLGIGNVVDTIWNAAGVSSAIPQLDNIRPVVVPLVAAAVYIAVGAFVYRLDGGNLLGIIVGFAGAMMIGIGAREAISGLMGGVTAVKSIGSVTA